MTKKIASVTGSRRGIGLAIAEKLAAAGYHVVLSGVSAEADSQDVLNRVRAVGGADYIRCDISSAEDRQQFMDAIQSRYGRLDVHVNNAGIAPRQRLDLLETTEESFDDLIHTNLKGTFFMSQLAANRMIAMQNAGLDDYKPRLVNICSISAETASVNRGEYCVSKAGISMVTKLFADKLAAFGIPVFEVRPGIIRTDMTQAVTERYEKQIANGLTPIRRMGEPGDVADCVMAAVSGLLDFATGQVLCPDGGFHISRL